MLLFADSKKDMFYAVLEKAKVVGRLHDFLNEKDYVIKTTEVNTFKFINDFRKVTIPCRIMEETIQNRFNEYVDVCIILIRCMKQIKIYIVDKYDTECLEKIYKFARTCMST